MKLLKFFVGLTVAVALTACGGGGGNPGTTSGGTPAPTPAASSPAAANLSVSSISINSSPAVLNADGTSTVTLTLYALTSGNASVAGATIDLAATNGVILSTPSVVTTATGANGATGATVTMTAASSDQTNRLTTVTASCSGCAAVPATAQVKVVGASVMLTNSGGTSLIVGGTTSTLTATIKNFSGTVMSGVDVSFAATDPLILGLSAASVKTNSSGQAKVTVSALAAGNTTVNVSALGDAKSQPFVAGAPAAVLAVTSPANNSVLITNTPAVIAVSAPAGATSVTFATTVGTFSNGLTSQSVSVVGGTASATLKSAQAGTATVTVIDSLSNTTNVTLVVSPPVSAANKILLNASQTTVPLSPVGGNQNSLTLTARAISSNGVTDQAVANVPIQFSMIGGPGAGEFLSPALAYTNSAGVAVATFTAGTAASISNGIAVSAAIPGAAVQTGTAPSGTDVLLTIGGQALSVAFGPASVLSESSDKTLYVQAYSVQVTDANNNPVSGQVVTLRMRPVAFSTGTPCAIVATYCSEDVNGNGSLDAGEDGTRTLLATATDAGSCPTTAPLVTGNVDTGLTPPNSDGGGIPATVTTDVNGTAAFNLTYLKGSALWVVDRLTATVSSNGTEATKSTIFRLAATVPDTTPICSLPASPYSF
ncbi:beta strand repeat-containing protein [Rhodoferax ferrireducens]|uniref:beta strand repeat-containing protein n=1 Tax=Rhodoferax ferrireducens TaxID=192843 RepID=UPI003BB5C416